jgi:hypothetical protein
VEPIFETVACTPKNSSKFKVESVDCDPPRGSMPTGSRDFAVVWSVGAGIPGVYCTLQT